MMLGFDDMNMMRHTHTAVAQVLASRSSDMSEELFCFKQGLEMKPSILQEPPTFAAQVPGHAQDAAILRAPMSELRGSPFHTPYSHKWNLCIA